MTRNEGRRKTANLEGPEMLSFAATGERGNFGYF